MKHYSASGGLLIYKDFSPDAKVYWHLYDREGRSILTFFDFIAFRLNESQSTANEVESYAYSLKMWFEYLFRADVNQFDATDHHIVEFRSLLLERQSHNLKDNYLARRRSINVNLRAIYKFYEWLQRSYIDERQLTLLGTNGCNITSALLEVGSYTDWNSRCYPLLFKKAGKGSKHKIMHIPTNLDREATQDYFHATQQASIAGRNVLMMDIATRTGLRRNSILSLRISQFTKVLLEKHESANRPYLVTPKVQKLAYSNHFEFSYELVLRIIEYISDSRMEIVSKTKSTSDCLFLSIRTGMPLTSKAATNIFTRASRNLDQPKDFGLHGHRRYFANDTLGTNYEASLEIGGDTSIETLSAITASAMGHSNPRSQEAYMRDMLKRFKHTHALQQRDEVARLKDENARLRAELNQTKIRK